MALAAVIAMTAIVGTAQADVFTNIPEAATYQLVYDLNIPSSAAFNYNAIPYSVDNSASITEPFGRVAYYMELQKPSGPLEYVWASMDAFTTDASKLGVPSRGPNGSFTDASGKFQQIVSNMNVASNVPSIVTGKGIDTGNIEFWSSNYSNVASGTVPGGSSSTFDFDDIHKPESNYGSMQIHNYGEQQTLMAYNSWGSGSGEMGIGNQPTDNPDWTFSGNNSSYSVKRLQVLVENPAISALPDSGDYTLVYKLPIPNTGGFNSASIPYSVDNSDSLVNPIDRVAYCLELQDAGGNTQYATVSMDPFTPNPKKLGVPKAGTGAFFQQNVTNMDVVSNVPGVVNTTGTDTGNIEFWPSNYGTARAAASPPNADGATYDFGDSGGNTGAGHACMQIHNSDTDGAGPGTAGQTVIAYNHWGPTGGTASVGIGNQPSGHPDWTFSYNAGDYTVKNLYVLARENTDGVYQNVPEAADFKTIYSLNIPDSANYLSTQPNYTIDTHNTVTQPIDRVAYYMELQKPDGQLEYAYVSMDAFTQNTGKLGIPTVASGALFQQFVSNMNVVSNVPGVATGTGLATGNIEMWPGNYGTTNSLPVPNASGSTHDFGDYPYSGTYGSLQIHNHDTDGTGPGTTGQTVIAYNRWGGSSGTSDVGIGPNTTGSGTPDYTFSGTADDYRVKNIHVLVHEDPVPGVYRNVPEAADYSLVYAFKDIPTNSSGWATNPVPYAVDNSATTGTYDRVAYYLELAKPDGDLEYVYVSCDPFTFDASKLGVPSAGTKFQQLLSHVNIASNASAITTGTDLRGNIEFWPTDYGRENTSGAGIGIPGASDGVYDFGDNPRTTGSHGSMQIHNFDAAQTLFAYNAWGSARTSTLGIGTNTTGTGDPDWTFNYNAGDYRIKNMYVLAREADAALVLNNPTGRRVFQRDDTNHADILVDGAYAGDVTRIEARAVPMAGYSGTATPWQLIDGAPSGGAFSDTLSLLPGWYDIEVRAYNGTTLVAQNNVEKIGVGEVFVTCGQSNSANSGSGQLIPADDRVNATHPYYGIWQFAADPQPLATGSGGSPWPALGDALIAELDMPVGLISVGWGGTRVGQWQPGGTLYPRLEEALTYLGPEGCRAVLWHQGESDASAGTTATDYAALLEALIAESRTDAGWDVPWGIALASYRPGVGGDPDIIDGQWMVINGDELVFAGAMTDDMIVPYRDGSTYGGIHFNTTGLTEHGLRWYTAVRPYVVPEPATLSLLAFGVLGLAARRKRRR